MPNRERVKALVDALRSGEFKQTTGALKRDDDCYCVQGVACEVFRRATGLGQWVAFGDGKFGFDVRCNSAAGLMPILVSDWFGLPGRDPLVTGEDGLRCSLVGMNDMYHASLGKLADMIEKEYLNA